MRELLRKAYLLAFFIHCDDDVAAQIVVGAAEKLELAATAQAKRKYYRYVPRRSSSAPTNDRAGHKIWLSDAHLLQRLVYIESEAHEKRKEGSNPDEDELIVYFIKHLIRIALRRNSFYMAVGLSRLLHCYSTAETMQIYDAVVQDPGLVKDAYYYRSRKGVLMNELKERFGDLLRSYKGPHGEERFCTHDRPAAYAELVRECLTVFCPWATACVIPEAMAGFAEIPAFVARSRRDYDRVEVNRIHALTHPQCYQRLIRALGLHGPDERLAVPQFFLSQNNNGDGSATRRLPTPDSTDQQLDAIEAELAHNAARRRRSAAGLLRVMVDGVERARLDRRHNHRTPIEIEPNAELIEIVSHDSEGELLLATHLINNDEDLSKGQCYSTQLESGERIAFETDSQRDSRSRAIAIVYRTGLSFRARTMVRKAAANVSSLLTIRSRKWTGVLLATLLTTALILTLLAYLRTRDGQTLVTDSNPAKESVAESGKTPETDSGLQDEQTSAGKRETPNRKPKENSPALRAQSQRDKGRASIADDDASVTDAIRSPVTTGLSLAQIKKVFLEPAGERREARAVVELLSARLRKSDRLVVTQTRDDADAVLLVMARDSSQEAVIFEVSLVNAKGDIIWPGKRKRIYFGPAPDVAALIANNLFADSERVRRK